MQPDSVESIPFGCVAVSPVGENWLMVPLHVQLMDSTLRGVLKRLHFPLEVMLVCLRWYAACRNRPVYTALS